MIRCTRWEELHDTVLFHAKLSEVSACKVEFRLLNGFNPIIIGDRDDDGNNFRLLEEKMQEPPQGATPICRHLKEICNKIIEANEGLTPDKYKKSVLVIATDGEPSDGVLSEYLAPLIDYPVWIVVRLCTDTEPVVNYWNTQDKELEMEMDMIDDYISESRGVYKYNKWLSYGEPLHRLREWGFSTVKELDFLDENTLTHTQMHVIMNLL
jgi:hypothetical protein